MKEKTLSEVVGANVADLRERLSLSQEKLAAKAKISKVSLRKIERGTASNPTLDTIGRIANALGVTVKDLLVDASDTDEMYMDDESTYTEELYQINLENACYPPGFGKYRVTTLMQLLVYLPLLIRQPHIYNSLIRIGGNFEGEEEYVLKQVDYCVSKIPMSPEREYADVRAQALSKEAHQRRDMRVVDWGAAEPGSKEYAAVLEQVERAFKLFKAMRDQL